MKSFRLLNGKLLVLALCTAVLLPEMGSAQRRLRDGDRAIDPANRKPEYSAFVSKFDKLRRAMDNVLNQLNQEAGTDPIGPMSATIHHDGDMLEASGRDEVDVIWNFPLSSSWAEAKRARDAADAAANPPAPGEELPEFDPSLGSVLEPEDADGIIEGGPAPTADPDLAGGRVYDEKVTLQLGARIYRKVGEEFSQPFSEPDDASEAEKEFYAEFEFRVLMEIETDVLEMVRYTVADIASEQAASGVEPDSSEAKTLAFVAEQFGSLESIDELSLKMTMGLNMLHGLRKYSVANKKWELDQAKVHADQADIVASTSKQELLSLLQEIKGLEGEITALEARRVAEPGNADEIDRILGPLRFQKGQLDARVEPLASETSRLEEASAEASARAGGLEFDYNRAKSSLSLLQILTDFNQNSDYSFSSVDVNEKLASSNVSEADIEELTNELVAAAGDRYFVLTYAQGTSSRRTPDLLQQLIEYTQLRKLLGAEEEAEDEEELASDTSSEEMNILEIEEWSTKAPGSAAEALEADLANAADPDVAEFTRLQTYLEAELARKLARTESPSDSTGPAAAPSEEDDAEDEEEDVDWSGPVIDAALDTAELKRAVLTIGKDKLIVAIDLNAIHKGERRFTWDQYSMLREIIVDEAVVMAQKDSNASLKSLLSTLRSGLAGLFQKSEPSLNEEEIDDR